MQDSVLSALNSLPSPHLCSPNSNHPSEDGPRSCLHHCLPSLTGIVRKNIFWRQSPVQILALYPVTVGEESYSSDPISLLCNSSNAYVDLELDGLSVNLTFAIWIIMEPQTLL